MSIAGEFEAVLQRAGSAIEQALSTDVSEWAKSEIQISLLKNVYSYAASPEAMAKRRMASGGLLDRSNMQSVVSGGNGSYTLTITDEADMQEGGGGLADIVTQGLARYRQPYPRPFMEPAEQAMAESGDVERLIKAALTAAGL